MKYEYFDIEEEQEQNERASDPANFALVVAHVNAVYKTDFAEWFLRMLTFRRVRRVRANWEPDAIAERMQWRLKYYKDALKNEHALQSKIAKNPDFKTASHCTADRKRAKAFKVCAANGVAGKKWSEAKAQEIIAEKLREKLRRALPRLFPDRAR